MIWEGLPTKCGTVEFGVYGALASFKYGKKASRRIFMIRGRDWCIYEDCKKVNRKRKSLKLRKIQEALKPITW